MRKSGIQEGLVLCNAMHITASVFINDDEPGLHEDYKTWLEELAPFDPSPTRYQHNRTGEDNADAHHKRQVMGREVVVAITKGKLDFGPWEQIFYGEFDGRTAQAGAGQGDRGVGFVRRAHRRPLGSRRLCVSPARLLGSGGLPFLDQEMRAGDRPRRPRARSPAARNGRRRSAR